MEERNIQSREREKCLLDLRKDEDFEVFERRVSMWDTDNTIPLQTKLCLFIKSLEGHIKEKGIIEQEHIMNKTLKLKMMY